MDKTLGVVIPDEDMVSSVQKITFSNGAYGFYLETGLGCALVFPDGKTIFDVQFLGEQGREAYASDDVAFVEFRDGRVYQVDSEWRDLRYECDEWNYIEGFFTIDPSEPVFVEKSEFDEAFSRFQNTIFCEPCESYAAFVPIRDSIGFAKN
jgi:hypothetical protein